MSAIEQVYVNDAEMLKQILRRDKNVHTEIERDMRTYKSECAAARGMMLWLPGARWSNVAAANAQRESVRESLTASCC